ncbi:MAG: cytochrome c3 family protein [Gallionellaceae bacterium]|nr:cytochrome c3 family protein [Gallionellaceae bacterium]
MDRLKQPKLFYAESHKPNLPKTGRSGNKWRVTVYITAGALLLTSGGVLGARISDVRGTKHNLSAAADGSSYQGGIVPERTVKAKTETEICVFCHTPHGAAVELTPLWNRQLSSATYIPYTSSALDANILQGTLDQPGGSSKLCLSCHDGTLAIGNVNVLNGASSGVPGAQTIEMLGTDIGGVIAPGSGEDTGYTRNIGVDLTNDHPISVSYTSALAERDGELRMVDSHQRYPAGFGSIIGVRTIGLKPKAPLEQTGAGGVGQVQCGACHDPHLRETDVTLGDQKFLRLNRFQAAQPALLYNDVNDINCVACHDKNQGAGTWIYSSHANPLVATQTYTDQAASQRDFPKAADGAPSNLPVWKASCLNCHDTHTVQGSRMLLREGTDSTAVPKTGGGSAIEETCYQCHSNDATTAITPLATVADIKSDYTLIGGRRMPIASAEQPAGTEVHEIGGNFSQGGIPFESVDCSSPTNKCGADFIERRSKLGTSNLNNRHAECTDCHNPHRTVKFKTFAPPSLASTPDESGTHNHSNTAGYTHTNIASGALRGTFGVEPVYGSASFNILPFNYEVKRGDPGTNSNTDVTAPYVTREYQICLKCHSEYGYSDNNMHEFASDRPRLQMIGGSLTPAGTNGLNFYTNQAKEFQAPIFHKGEVPTIDSGAAPAYANGTQMNYRSWHPVMDNTGRTSSIRGGVNPASLFTLPWSNDVGNQTMYCSDCHGSNVLSTTSVIPDPGKSWGPHGSANDFILKGTWNSTTGTAQTNGLCFKCHDYGTYAGGGGAQTGFFLGGEIASSPAYNQDGHAYHFQKIGRVVCTWCHVAVPHGWKNKGLLVNLNDVGPEAGLPAGTQVRNNTPEAYTQAPYYLNAMLKIKNFKSSGQWSAADCGSAGAPGNGAAGKAWMDSTSTENCTTPP